MDRTELHQLGCKLRALGSTRGEWLDYVEGTLALLLVAKAAPQSLQCPDCAERRQRKTLAQKKWRASKRDHQF